MLSPLISVLSSVIKGFTPDDQVHVKNELGEKDDTYQRTYLLKDALRKNWVILITSAVFLFSSNLITLLSVSFMSRSQRTIGRCITEYDADSFTDLGYVLSAYFTIQMAGTLSSCLGEYLNTRLGISVRKNLLVQIYSSLLLSDSVSHSEKGSVLNAMTVDLNSVEHIFISLHYLWAAPLQCLLILVSLYLKVKWYCLIGAVVMSLYLVTQVVGLILLKKFRRDGLAITDKRLHRCANFLSNIKIIKAMNLEEKFITLLNELRSDEVIFRKKYLFFTSFSIEINAFFIIAAITATVLTLVLRKAADFITILAVIKLFENLRHQFKMIPISYVALNDGLVSTRRISSLLSKDGQVEESLRAVDIGEFVRFYQESSIANVPKGSVVSASGISTDHPLKMVRALSKIGSVAFCPKIPCLLNMSVRENILFGGAYCEKRYLNVLSQCQLSDEFEKGERDLLLVEDNESNLSGGQRARIALSRALYAVPDYLVLDDIFTSLDSRTAESIVDECFLKKPSHMTVFYYGRMTLVDAELHVGSELRLQVHRSTNFKAREFGTRDIAGFSVFKAIRSHDLPTSNKVFLNWLKGAGIGVVLVAVICKCAIHFSRLDYDTRIAKMNFTSHDLSVYLSMALLQILLPHLHSVYIYLSGLKAASLLHTAAIRNIFGSSYPSYKSQCAKVLNVLGTDQDCADISLPIYLGALSTIAASFVFTCVGIIWKNSLMIIPILIALVVFYFIGSNYRKNIRRTRRNESELRNTIYQRSNDLLTGKEIIRGLHLEKLFTKDMRTLAFNYCGKRLLSISLTTAFTIKIMLLGNALAVTIGVLAALARMNSAMAALAFSYSIKLPSMVLLTVRKVSKLESHMISYERLFDLSKEFKQERNEGKKRLLIDKAPEIEFRDISLEIGPVKIFNALTLSIKAGEKTCITGRTGSGKSSLLLMLLRLYESTSGSIYIDSQDIQNTDLASLRRSIAFSPQEPQVFFNHSVRFNIDPESRLKDFELWPLLKTLRLSRDLDDCLTDKCSVQDMDKICICRALARASKILLFDEPLCSIHAEDLSEILCDLERLDVFANRTVIIVSHRPEFMTFCRKVVQITDGFII